MRLGVLFELSFYVGDFYICQPSVNQAIIRRLMKDIKSLFYGDLIF